MPISRAARSAARNSPSQNSHSAGDLARTALITVCFLHEGLHAKNAGSFEAAFGRAFRAVVDSGVTGLVIDVRGNERRNGEYPALPYRPRVGRFTGRLHIFCDGGSSSITNAFILPATAELTRGGRPVILVGEANGEISPRVG